MATPPARLTAADRRQQILRVAITLFAHQGFKGTTTSVSVPAYDASHNARQDVVAGSCTGDSSTGYTLKGTVQNSSTSPRTYSITVDFVTKSGDTVMATRVVNVGPVDPHASKNWSTPSAGHGQANLTCVIRQALWS